MRIPTKHRLWARGAGGRPERRAHRARERAQGRRAVLAGGAAVGMRVLLEVGSNSGLDRIFIYM